MTDYTEIINSRKDLPGGLIEAYHAIQREYNYIPEEAVREAAQVFGLPLAKAFGVATFYSYLKVGQRGKYVIRICASAPCHIAGASEVVDALEKELGIKMGETTEDGKFTLEWAECVGQCQDTPVFTVNGKPFGGLNREQISQVLSLYK
ncbi:complex I 24 kDa subunit family protein [Candidatus Formimonas warabiya]|uniref:NADH-quinone oxidoreductase subunit NuoE family protein n=1 Tax=Formimonas warabiya TaxID=1761012 RepID=UPI0011D0521E|nr:NAD(P)H-dependent oxidoreductase subunit E [Candidatus Formimonas warabiya]